MQEEWAMSEAPRLVAEGLSRRFGRRDVVRDVAVDLSPGEVVGLLGPNGRGRPRFSECFLGLCAPVRGRSR